MPFKRNSSGLITWSQDDGNNSLQVGNISGGNYFEIESDGTFKLNGDAEVWKDANTGGLPGSGGASPDRINWDSTNIEVWAFDGGATTEEVFGWGELQHDYAEGTELKFHIHFEYIL